MAVHRPPPTRPGVPVSRRAAQIGRRRVGPATPCCGAVESGSAPFRRSLSHNCHETSDSGASAGQGISDGAERQGRREQRFDRRDRRRARAVAACRRGRDAATRLGDRLPARHQQGSGGASPRRRTAGSSASGSSSARPSRSRATAGTETGGRRHTLAAGSQAGRHVGPPIACLPTPRGPGRARWWTTPRRAAVRGRRPPDCR